MKVYTPHFSKPNKQQVSMALPSQGPRQKTLDAIMAIASQYNALANGYKN